jgi:hypothetical protein
MEDAILVVLLSFSLYSNGFKFKNDTQASDYR